MLTLSEYQALIEQAPILIWRANTDALCDYFNDRWLAFRGRTMEQKYGNGWAEGIHPEDFDRYLKNFLDSFNKREVFEMESRYLREVLSRTLPGIKSPVRYVHIPRLAKTNLYLLRRGQRVPPKKCSEIVVKKW